MKNRLDNEHFDFWAAFSNLPQWTSSSVLNFQGTCIISINNLPVFVLCLSGQFIKMSWASRGAQESSLDSNECNSVLCNHQYSRGKVVAANHVPRTQHVVLASCIIRYEAHLCVSCVPQNYQMPRPLFIYLFYFRCADSHTTEIKQN